MVTDSNEGIIRMYWSLISDQKWNESKKLFHSEFCAEWPQSRERFTDVDSFINMNSAYPGNHKVEIIKLLSSENKVTSAVFIYADTGQKAFATSFFELKNEKIIKLTEFWGEPYEAPEWRSKYSQRY